MNILTKSDTYLKGDSSSACFWGYEKIVKIICKKYLSPDSAAAEDLAHEILIKVSKMPPEKIARVRDKKAWITRVTYNECMNYFRSTKEHRERMPRSRRKVVPIKYSTLPADLREGIEKSLILVTSVFQTRDKLKKYFEHEKQTFKAIERIEEARRLTGRTARLTPDGKILQRFLYLRDYARVELGTPEGERTENERRAEIEDLEKKYGAQALSVALLLYQAECELMPSKLTHKESLDLIPGRYLVGDSIWVDHLSEIFGMRISPLNLVYKVWSKAPGFKTGGSGKYRSHKLMGLALHHHKLVSKGTGREFIFSAIKDNVLSSNRGIRETTERFRKPGYGKPLQKKFKWLVNLIYRESFLLKV